MKRLVYLCLIVLFFSLSCSSDPSPSQSELKQSLAVQLPAFVEISNYSIEAAQNAGTKVEPIHQSRFKAFLTLKNNTYLNAGRDGSVLFIGRHKKQGDTIEIFGKSESRLYAGKWKTIVSLDGSPLQTLGKPESMFSASKVIVKGSEEESAYYAEKERIKKEKQETLRKEAEARATLSAKMTKTLAGKWQTAGNAIYAYHKDGTFLHTTDKGKKVKGKWRVHDGKLILNWETVGGVRSFIVTKLMIYS